MNKTVRLKIKFRKKWAIMKIRFKIVRNKNAVKQSYANKLHHYVKKITQLEEKMNKFSSELANIENQLADAELYNAENKEKLTALLAQQVDVKKALDDVETEWMTAQEELEEMLQA